MRNKLVRLLTLLSAILVAPFLPIAWADEAPLQPQTMAPFVVVLGTAQDGGFPQAGCAKECCAAAWRDPAQRRFVSCVAVIDPESKQRWMLDCTPDFRDQLKLLDEIAPGSGAKILDGVFPTHAHVGHYAGLMHLGREIMGASAIDVFAMPRMKYFLETNGPWSQLVELRQIELRRIAAGATIALNQRISIAPFLVPHRDEFSETVGFHIQGPNRSVVYLPDIDKWERWEVRIEDVIADADLALLDGTFFSGGELQRADMSVIPHPFVVESLTRFKKSLAAEQRASIRFIHLNHSNPLLRLETTESQQVTQAGMGVAQQGDRFSL